MEEARHGQAAVPGCGLAAFAILLLTICCLGLTGVSVSMFSVFTSWSMLRPTKLAYGGVVDQATLAPMREVGLLGHDEVPDAFHAENVDGFEACAVSTGRLLRITRSEHAEMPLASIQTVTLEADGSVTAVGERTINCPFGPDEGADRFVRMLKPETSAPVP